MSLIANFEFQSAMTQADLSTTLWARLRQEAEDALARERALAPIFVNSILNRPAFEDAVIHRISARLGNEIVPAYLVNDMFGQAVAGDATIGAGFRADIIAVLGRDPACDRLLEPLLYFKGFHAIQTHRLAHWLWTNGRKDFALYLQSRSSDVFQTDIHPAAVFGKGIFLDHATGLAVGATSVIDDDVSILQNVTLGGSGNETGDRHPKVRRGVMIGAGAKNSRQHRDRRMLADCRGLGRFATGAAQYDHGGRAGPGGGNGGLRRALAHHESNLEPACL